ncbi:MAG TPA: right-handed parallel beta-helix repeat-containing protein, partial [Kiritimatiellia bacterium]|nr:right-handed parallel beta-helix repeat-containing protein [Kiritimatiellia bacterium]
MKTTCIIGLILCAAGSFAANPEQVARVADGTLKEARASWWGFDPQDSTAALQAAIHSRVPRLIIDNMGAPWITDRLTGVSDQEIVFEPGTELLAKKGAFTGKADALLTLAGVTNVTLRGPGATLRMRRADYDAPPYAHAEWRHTLSIKSCANIKIIGLTLAESGGDGIYLGSLKASWPNRDILIRDVICDRNYRQGISVISAENLLIENTVMRDTAGTPPAAGIDFEPNHAGERLKNCVMRNCLTENNQGDGYEFYLPNLNAASEPVSIRLENCRSRGDRIALRVITGNAEADAVRGTMTVEACRFEQAQRNAVMIGRKPPHGMALTLDRCVVANCAAGTNAFSELLFTSRNDDPHPVGGIRFTDLIIGQPGVRPWIRCQSGAEYEPLTDLSGTVTLRQPGAAEQRIALTPAWILQTFPPRFTVRVPRVTPDLATAHVVNNVTGAQRLTPLRLRREGAYLFYAQSGEEVVLAGMQTQVGRYAPQAKPLIVRGADGRVLKSVPLPAFRERVEVRVTPPATGFYTVEVNVGANAFALIEANVPVAFETSKKAISLIASTGSLYAAVPQGTGVFAFGVSGEGESESVKATVRDPSGRVVWSRDAITLPERYTATGGEGAAGGLWQITLERPAAGGFEDFRVEALGIPPYLFL